MKAFLADEVKITPAILPSEGGAASTDLAGATLDMEGWDGVLMMVTFGVITANAVTSIKAQEGTTTTPATDIEGTSQTVADDSDDDTFYIDLLRPTGGKRYVRVYVDRATQNAVIASAYYIQYRGRSVPTTHGTGVSGEKHAHAAAGTA